LKLKKKTSKKRGEKGEERSLQRKPNHREKNAPRKGLLEQEGKGGSSA